MAASAGDGVAQRDLRFNNFSARTRSFTSSSYPFCFYLFSPLHNAAPASGRRLSDGLLSETRRLVDVKTEKESSRLVVQSNFDVFIIGR